MVSCIRLVYLYSLFFCTNSKEVSYDFARFKCTEIVALQRCNFNDKVN